MVHTWIGNYFTHQLFENQIPSPFKVMNKSSKIRLRDIFWQHYKMPSLTKQDCTTSLQHPFRSWSIQLFILQQIKLFRYPFLIELCKKKCMLTLCYKVAPSEFFTTTNKKHWPRFSKPFLLWSWTDHSGEKR